MFSFLLPLHHCLLDFLSLLFYVAKFKEDCDIVSVLKIIRDCKRNEKHKEEVKLRRLYLAFSKLNLAEIFLEIHV